jgi:hypothetical protein
MAHLRTTGPDGAAGADARGRADPARRPRRRERLPAAAVGLGAVPAASPVLAAHWEVTARADWTPIPADGPILEVYAAGLWSADPALWRVRVRGHGDIDRPCVTAADPFDALLIPNPARRVRSDRDLEQSAMGALLGGRPMRAAALHAPINDSPDGLADNDGSVILCIETAAE